MLSGVFVHLVACLFPSLDFYYLLRSPQTTESRHGLILTAFAIPYLSNYSQVRYGSPIYDNYQGTSDAGEEIRSFHPVSAANRLCISSLASSLTSPVGVRLSVRRSW